MTAPLDPSVDGTVARLRALGVLPVVELDTIEVALPLADALAAGGLPVAEITLRTAAGIEALHLLRRERPELLVGAGTVRTLGEAERALESGAQFIVSPSIRPELVELCLTNGIACIPGTCTPTEIDAAARAGAPLVKFFPAEQMGGIAFLKAVAGPFRDVQFVPTGGINVGNLARYLELPCVAACGGSWLVAPAILRERDFERVQSLAREAAGVVAQVRAMRRVT